MPTLNEIPEVARLLATLLAGKPATHGALTVVSLMAPDLDDPDWLTLDDVSSLSPQTGGAVIPPSPHRGEGQGEGAPRVQITEISEAGSVPFLKVANDAAQPLLLLDGEELVGAKQNRILNTTVLVAARTELTIPVSCVEQGRWGYRDREFRPAAASLYSSVRARKAADVSRSVRAGRGHRADQTVVWSLLAQQAERLGVDSETAAMRDVYVHHEADIAAARHALVAQPGQVGALVYRAGRWAGLDIVAGPGLFHRAWPRLCTGYVSDAIGRRPRRQLRPAAGAVLAWIAQSPAHAGPAVGLGEEHRLDSSGHAGAVLIAERRVAHLMAFPVNQ